MGVERFLIATAVLAIPFAFAAVAEELIVRRVAPQNLTGTWLEVGSQGLILNRFGARARTILAIGSSPTASTGSISAGWHLSTARRRS
jgi:hypothetical protein